jgi:transposase
MSAQRFVGIDIHKRAVVVSAVDAQQEVVLKPEKVSVQRFESWAKKNLRPTDQIALEATSNTWAFHDLLTPLVENVNVANTYKLKLISSSAHKTDKHDALVLAKLLAARLLPTVWVPPQEVRELRSLTQHRARLVGKRNSAKNQLHAILHQHNLVLPEGGPFTQENEVWWASLPLSTTDKLQIRHFWLHIHHFRQLISETESFIAQLSVSKPWVEDMTFVVQIPGIGLYSGMAILAAIGDIRRFPTAKKLVGYSGLGARVRATGDTYVTGKISKQGRRELRTTLVASAWIAVRFSDYWREIFQQLATRIGKFKAITAIARKLLVLIWHVLTKKQADRNANAEAVARSFMTWSSQHHLARSQRVRRIEFVRMRLEKLGLLDQVTSFRANGRAHYFPTTP